MLIQVANTGLGDAIIFRLRSDLEHLATDVEGTIEKTAFAGWFRSSPDFRSITVRLALLSRNVSHTVICFGIYASIPIRPRRFDACRWCPELRSPSSIWGWNGE